jgi:RND superfamily putative drug exporter
MEATRVIWYECVIAPAYFASFTRPVTVAESSPPFPRFPYSPLPSPADDVASVFTLSSFAPVRLIPRETSSMFKFLGRFTATHPRKICAAWLGAGLLLTLLAPSWDARTQDDDVRFLPERCDSVRGYHLFKDAFPLYAGASRAIFVVERSDRKLTRADLEMVDKMTADLNALRDDEPDLEIGKVQSRLDPFIGKRLVSADGQCALIQMSLASPYLALQTRKAVDHAEARLRQRLAEAGADAPRLLTSGAAGVGRDLITASEHSFQTTTIATIVLVVVVLLLVYRAPLLALVPLTTIAISVWVALKALALCTLIPGFYLVNVSKVFAIVLLYGAGTDYCLFLLSRFREELGKGQGMSSAISRSVGGVGGALAASAATVICGLGLMCAAEFAKVRYAGPAIALSLTVVLLASLTLTPALLHLLGARVFWPSREPVLRETRWQTRTWEWISAKVVERPLLTWSVAAAILLPLILLGLRVKPSHKPTGELGPWTASVQGIQAIQRHYTAGETGPITVLLSSPMDWNSKQGQQLIHHLSQGFCRLDNVAEVRSLTQPLGKPLAEAPLLKTPQGKAVAGAFMQVLQRGASAVRGQARQAARAFYTADLPPADGAPRRHVARLDVVLRSDPFEPRSIETLEVLQTWLREELPRSPLAKDGVAAECYGVTVNSRDLARVTDADRARINTLVLAAVFLILLVLVRRPWLAAYLLGTVLLSYFATLGATALVGRIIGGRPLTEVDWRVPFFLFTMLVAVGEDYNILLIARLLQERKRFGWEEGTRRALAFTGGTITTCGLIMAGTFTTLMLARLSTLVQVGFALGFGVLLDTFVVRPFLVPAFTLLVARWRGDETEDDAPIWMKLRWPRRRAG